jgi:hypothetical protein
MAKHIFLRLPVELAELIASVCEQSAYLTKEEALRKGETDLSANESVQTSAAFAKDVRSRVEEAKLELEAMALEFVFKAATISGQSFAAILDSEGAPPVKINESVQEIILALIAGNHPQLKHAFESGQQYIESLKK